MKPGHWCELRQPLRANLSDESLSIVGTAVDPKPPFSPLQILDLSTPMTFDRNAVLARGQRKLLNYELFFPSLSADLLDELADQQAAIRVSISPRSFGAAVYEEAYPVIALQPYQNSIVVVSENPERYQFLGGLSCMTWPSTERGASEKLSPYRVVSIAAAEVQDCLPSRLQTLTSTSHLVWNDCNAASLTEAQQQAVLDWLHFGGQIIVNGPEAEAGLQGSFLEAYLPLKNIRGTELNESEWIQFGSDWSVPAVGSQEAQKIRLPQNRKVPGISGEPTKNARWIKGCEGFVAEVSVAAGRIAMTTFPLGEELLVRWPSYGSFFNAALLGQPPRAWTRSGSASEVQDGLGELNFIGAMRGQEQNPAVTTKLRLLGRDLGRMQVDRRRTDSPKSRSNGFESEERKEHGDVCRIESDAALANAAAVALQTASGINVPRTSKIVKLLLGISSVWCRSTGLSFGSLGGWNGLG